MLRRRGDLASLRESTLLRLHAQNDSSPTYLASLRIQIGSKGAKGERLLAHGPHPSLAITVRTRESGEARVSTLQGTSQVNS